MPLAPATRLGAYEIVSLLGAGGMGEVYRARDTRLNRDVAIKILPDVFAADVDRVARFRREAQVLASLNHPHIAQIYGLEQTDHTSALVLELVDGPTLADRIAQGPLTIEEALPIARQIAEALETAHEHGIIHRDLKPANIKLRSDGTVKVLDFGLAKAMDGSHGSGPQASGLSQSPTITSPAMTMGQMILGTAAYMSPEQAKGKPVDQRADVWAFGCVIYEMLTGQRTFAAEDVSDTLAFVLTKEPDWNLLPATTPPSLRAVLQRCLAKDPKQRVRAVGDIHLALDGAFELAGRAVVDVSAPSRRRVAALLVSCTLLSGVLTGAGVWFATRPSGSARIHHLSMAISADAPLSTVNQFGIAISPDAKHVAYVAIENRVRLLYLHDLGLNTAVPIQGTERANRPFFSPDGEWIGFFAGGKLKKVSVSTGVPSNICDTGATVVGGSWGEDSTIVFSSTTLGGVVSGTARDARLYRVGASGGRPEQLLEDGSGQTNPQILPGGRVILFTRSAAPGQPEIALLSSDTKSVQTLQPGLGARYVRSGHLVFTNESSITTLMVVPFDLRSLRTAGATVPLVETAPPSPALLAVSNDGVLVYGNSVDTVTPRPLLWVDRNGRTTNAFNESDGYRYPTLSPDGQRVAVGVADDIWVIDLQRKNRTRLTNNDRVPPVGTRAGSGAPVPQPIWSPDGKHVTFGSMTSSREFAIEWTRADGSGGRQPLLKLKNFAQPGSWTPDGRTLVFYQTSVTGNARDIWTFQPGNDPAPLLETKFNERAPRLSPDGKWLAYVSDSSGRDEVYLRPLAVQSGQTTISNDGGAEPLWSRDGRELYYRVGSRLMAVPVTLASTVSVGEARIVFEGPFMNADPGGQFPNYDVAPDGKRFLMIAGDMSDAFGQIPSLNVVINWFAELKQRAPAR
jgi:serine/threonine-protein kinase